MADISHPRGDTFSRTLTFVDSAGAAYDLTGCTIYWTAKNDPADGDSEAVQAYTSASEITIDDDPTTGLATLIGPPADTDDLAVNTRLYYAVQVVDASGNVWTAEIGTITITDDVQRAVA